MIPVSPHKGEEKLDKEAKNHQKNSEIEQLKEKNRQLKSNIR